jgi:1-phosphatidylinositol phosphodiesterase
MKYLKRILAAVLSLLLVAILVFFTIPLTERRDKTPVEGSADWMAVLSDELPLSSIYIPGTHDSASNHVQLGYFSKCQASDIKTQLEDGFRYLDIRLGFDGDQLVLWHGFCKCRTGAAPWSPALSLNDILEQCYAFLDEHPGETIVFVAKNERNDDDTEFQRAVNKAVSKDPGRWLLTSSIPTLGESRGRIVLFRQYTDALSLASNSGIQMSWPKQNAGVDLSESLASVPQPAFDLFIQDRYKYDADEKWEAFKYSLKAAEGSDGLVVSFLSTNGSPAYGHPYKYAVDLNKRFLAEDISFAPPCWIIIDFSSAPLAEKVWSLNQ